MTIIVDFNKVNNLTTSFIDSEYINIIDSISPKENVSYTNKLISINFDKTSNSVEINESEEKNKKNIINDKTLFIDFNKVSNTARNDYLNDFINKKDSIYRYINKEIKDKDVCVTFDKKNNLTYLINTSDEDFIIKEIIYDKSICFEFNKINNTSYHVFANQESYSNPDTSIEAKSSLIDSFDKIILVDFNKTNNCNNTFYYDEDLLTLPEVTSYKTICVEFNKTNNTTYHIMQLDFSNKIRVNSFNLYINNTYSNIYLTTDSFDKEANHKYRYKITGLNDITLLDFTEYKDPNKLYEFILNYLEIPFDGNIILTTENEEGISCTDYINLNKEKEYRLNIRRFFDYRELGLKKKNVILDDKINKFI